MSLEWTPYLEVVSSPNSVFNASLVTQEAPKYTPPKTGADVTSNLLQKSGAALYEWSQAHLREHRPGRVKYSLRARASIETLLPGDTIFVKSKALAQFMNPYTREVLETSIEVEEDLRVLSLSRNFSDSGIVVQYELENRS